MNFFCIKCDRRVAEGDFGLWRHEDGSLMCEDAQAKAEERQPDEVLRERAREFISNRPPRPSGETERDIIDLVDFAQSIQAESRQEIELLQLKLYRADKEIEALNLETCDVKCPNCGYSPIFAAYQPLGADQQLAEARAQAFKEAAEIARKHVPMTQDWDSTVQAERVMRIAEEIERAIGEKQCSKP